MASPQLLQLLAEQREAFCQGFASGFVELARLQCRELALAGAGRRRQAEMSATDEQAGVGEAGVEASAFDNVKAKIQPQPEAECDSQDYAMEEHDGTFHAVRGQATCGGWPQADADSAAGGLGGSAAASTSWQLVSGRWLRDHLDVEASDAIDNLKALSDGQGEAVRRAETPEAEGEAAVRTAAGVGAPDIPAVARDTGRPLLGVLCSGSVESFEGLEKTISLGKGVDDPDGFDRRDFDPTATGPSSERSGCDNTCAKQLDWAIQAEEPPPGQPGQATRTTSTLVAPVTWERWHTNEKGNEQDIQKAPDEASKAGGSAGGEAPDEASLGTARGAPSGEASGTASKAGGLAGGAAPDEATMAGGSEGGSAPDEASLPGSAGGAAPDEATPAGKVGGSEGGEAPDKAGGSAGGAAPDEASLAVGTAGGSEGVEAPDEASKAGGSAGGAEPDEANFSTCTAGGSEDGKAPDEASKAGGGMAMPAELGGGLPTPRTVRGGMGTAHSARATQAGGGGEAGGSEGGAAPDEASLSAGKAGGSEGVAAPDEASTAGGSAGGAAPGEAPDEASKAGGGSAGGAAPDEASLFAYQAGGSDGGEAPDEAIQAGGSAGGVAPDEASRKLLELARQRGPAEESQARRLIQAKYELVQRPKETDVMQWCTDTCRVLDEWKALQAKLESQQCDRAGHGRRRARKGHSKAVQ